MSVDIINKKRTVDWNVYVAQRGILLIYAIFWSMIIVCLGYIWSFLCCVITVHGPQRINPTDFDYPPTFQVAPPKGWHIQYFVKYLNNYFLYYDTIYYYIYHYVLYRCSWSPDDEPQGVSDDTMAFQLAYTDPVWYLKNLQDGLAWSFVQTLMVVRGWILLTLLIPWLFQHPLN